MMDQSIIRSPNFGDEYNQNATADFKTIDPQSLGRLFTCGAGTNNLKIYTKFRQKGWRTPNMCLPPVAVILKKV